MPLEKPGSVANDPIKSAKWDEITEGRNFTRSDVPALSLLCQWHKIVELATDELDRFGEQTAYGNEMGDLKEFPQIGTLKKASAEIRALNKQLGIVDSHEEGEADSQQQQQASVLTVFQGGRAQRRARATG